ncbi:MAG: hypothetical protein HC913_03710, partial [Microscillaceae bacterium]|nr:hypothetical protein [Microscillaceae bacterium]
QIIPNDLKNTPLRHIAIILNDEFIAQLSVGQAVSEEAALAFQPRFFGCEEEGIRWIATMQALA